MSDWMNYLLVKKGLNLASVNADDQNYGSDHHFSTCSSRKKNITILLIMSSSCLYILVKSLTFYNSIIYCRPTCICSQTHLLIVGHCTKVFFSLIRALFCWTYSVTLLRKCLLDMCLYVSDDEIKLNQSWLGKVHWLYLIGKLKSNMKWLLLHVYSYINYTVIIKLKFCIKYVFQSFIFFRVKIYLSYKIL